MKALVFAAAALALACAAVTPEKQAWGGANPATPAPPDAGAEDRIAILERNCDARGSGSCVALGQMFEEGEGGAGRDPGRAFREYAKACRMGSSEGCERIERLLEADDKMPPDLRAVEAVLRDACSRGTARACVGLSSMYVYGLHVPESPEQARRLLRRACDASVAVACHRLGLILLTFPEGVDLDPGLSLLERGCALGHQLSCVKSADRLLRLGYENQRWFSGATSRSLERLRAACRAGEYGGCVAYAQAYLEGLGLPRDPAKGREILKAACDDGFARGCEALAVAVGDLEGRGSAEALGLWRRACQLRSGDACLRLASAQHPLPGAAGDTTPPAAADGDLAAAVKLVQRSCALRSPDGCASLAELHRRGLGVPRDPGLARMLSENACRLGAERDCPSGHLGRALRP